VPSVDFCSIHKISNYQPQNEENVYQQYLWSGSIWKESAAGWAVFEASSCAMNACLSLKKKHKPKGWTSNFPVQCSHLSPWIESVNEPLRFLSFVPTDVEGGWNVGARETAGRNPSGSRTWFPCWWELSESLNFFEASGSDDKIGWLFFWVFETRYPLPFPRWDLSRWL
jgi:hypothetical protein